MVQHVKLVSACLGQSLGLPPTYAQQYESLSRHLNNKSVFLVGSRAFSYGDSDVIYLQIYQSLRSTWTCRILPGLVRTCRSPEPVLTVLVTLVPAHAVGETQVAHWTTCQMSSGIYGCHVARHMGRVVGRSRPACQLVTCRPLPCLIAVLILCVVRAHKGVVKNGLLEEMVYTQRRTHGDSLHIV